MQFSLIWRALDEPLIRGGDHSEGGEPRKHRPSALLTGRFLGILRQNPAIACAGKNATGRGAA